MADDWPTDDTPYDAAFEWASNHVTSASVPTRVRLWREVMAPRLSDPDQLPPKAAWQTVAELLRATLHTYEDKDSQAAVADTLRAFCAVAPEFTSVFARVTAKKSKKDVSSRAAIRAGTLWLAAMLATQSASLSADADLWQATVRAVAKYLEAARSELNSAVPRRAIAAVLEESPEVVEAMLPVLAADGAKEPSLAQVDLIGLCIERALLPPMVIDDHVDVFLELFRGSVLSGRVHPEPRHLACYAPLLASLSHDAFGASVLPALKKVLLRSTDVGLAITGDILAALELDLSPYAADPLCGVVEKGARSDNATRKAHARAILSQLAAKASDPDVIRALIDRFFALLDGADGKVTYAHERASLYESVGILSAAELGSASLMAELAASTVDAFLARVTAEATEDAKVAGIAAVSAWLPLLPVFSPSLVDFFQAGLAVGGKGEDRVCRAHLAAVKASLPRDSPTDTEPLVPGLVSLAVAAASDPVALAAGINAVDILLQIGTEPAIGSTYADLGFWEAVGGSDSFMFSVHSRQRVSAVEDLAMVDSMVALRTSYSHVLAAGDDVERAWGVTFLGLATHDDHEVRQYANAALGRLCDAAPGVSGVFLGCWPAVLEPKVTANASAKPSTPFADGPSVVTAALQASMSGAIPDGGLWDLMAAAHHPFASAQPGHTWDVLMKNCGGLPSAVADAGPTLAAAAAANASNADPLWQAAALNAVYSLVGNPNTAGETVAALVDGITNCGVNALTDNEVKTFVTPANQIYSEEDPNDPEVVYDGVIAGRVRIDPETGLVTVGQSAGDLVPLDFSGRSKDDKEALRVQFEVRQRVLAVRQRCDDLVTALLVGTTSNPATVNGQLKHVFPVINIILVSPVTAESGLVLLKGLRECLAHALAPTLASSLTFGVARILNEAVVDAEWREEALPALLTRIITELVGTRVTAETVTFATPVLAAAAKRHDDVGVQRGVVAVIREHADLGDSLPRRALVDILCSLLSVSAVAADAHVGLVELSRGLGAEDAEALLNGFTASSSSVRFSSVSAFAASEGCLAIASRPDVAAKIFLLTHEGEGECADAANALWADCGLVVDFDPQVYYIPLLSDASAAIREMAGRALAVASDNNADALVATLCQLFRDNVPTEEAAPVSWEQDALTAARLQAQWQAQAMLQAQTRHGVAAALGEYAGEMSTASASALFDFMVGTALCDRDEAVRAAAVASGLSVLTAQGEALLADLFPLFEGQLEGESHNSTEDHVREGVVVFMGALSAHMSPDDDRVLRVIDSLFGALATPSASVQKAVATCLPALMPAIKAAPDQYLNEMVDRLLGSEVYGERRGAAYGLAGMIKGLGLSSLKKAGIKERLEDGVTNLKNANAREGALFAYEALSMMLGRLFEPYVRHIVGFLLDRHSDPNVNVRQAAVDASRMIMSQLTGHGVKQVLPDLLEKLQDDAWRTKQGGVQMLGNMAFCAPKQLSACLPQVVPELVEVLAETHAKLRASAQEALSQIGSVIRNPEVQELVPLLLAALTNPHKDTVPALEALLFTSFVHRVDAPSLALIVPVLHRGLRERSMDTKMKAAKIVGNMCTLTDAKDLRPYLDVLVPAVKNVLVDPIPEVRSVAARALGQIVSGLGETSFPELVAWLVGMLKTAAGNVERSGAAQGLSEVLGHLGVDRFDSVLPELLANTNHQDPQVREGFLNVFVFIPPILGDAFVEYIPEALPAVLQGLADESEFVRDTSFRAGQVLVNHFGKASLELLLPALEEGLFDDNWRIRQSSVSLLGDLLYLLSGVSGNLQINAEDSDDEGMAEANDEQLIEMLGEDNRSRVLSALYMMRSDVSAIVRQGALQVWKQIVTNTPRTLVEILTTLMQTLIECLASANPDKRQVAGRTLGDLVKKLGDRVLPQIIPILEDGLTSSDADRRQGVCLGLSEVMASTGAQQLTSYVDGIVPAIRTAVCDESLHVREAAAQAFDMLYRAIGNSALDDVLPHLLRLLDDRDMTAQVLDGLRQIMALRSRSVLPYLLPQLLAPPMSSFNARALAALAEVAGASLNTHISTILPALVNAMQSDDEAVADMCLEAAQSVVLAVNENGLHIVMSELLKAMKPDNPIDMRRNGAILAGALCSETSHNISSHVPALMHGLMPLFVEEDTTVCQAALDALAAVTETIRKEDSVMYIKHIRKALAAMASADPTLAETGVPGFNLKKGLAPLLPILKHGLMFGSPDVREQAALGIGDLVSLTSPAALKPYVVKTTGPLIRIIGDRFGWQVKAAILSTIAIIIDKGGKNLKPFLPQLQTTLVKALNDSTAVVRNRAASCLSQIIPLHTRIGPLLNELHTGAREGDASTAAIMTRALAGVLAGAAGKAKAKDLVGMDATLCEGIVSPEEAVRVESAAALAHLLPLLEADAASDLLSEHVLVGGGDWVAQTGRAGALSAVLKHHPELADPFEGEILDLIPVLLGADKAPTRITALHALYRFVSGGGNASQTMERGTALIPALATGLRDPTSDVRRRAIKVLRLLAKAEPMELVANNLAELVPPLFEAVKKKNLPTKLAAERALLHVLRVGQPDSRLEAYLETLSGQEAKTATDYSRKVLSKLSRDAESDDWLSADEAAAAAASASASDGAGPSTSTA